MKISGFVIITDCTKAGYDHYGRDFKRLIVNSHGECEKMCTKDVRCKKWTFAEWTNSGQCHLKSRNISRL